MSDRPDDICCGKADGSLADIRPQSPPILLSSVYRCTSPAQAQRLLEGVESGYAYQRDGHPNADWLADKCRRLHGADWCVVASSGMAALSSIALSHLVAGDHVVLSDRLYGRTLQLFTRELAGLGVRSSVVDLLAADNLASSLTAATRLVVAETISNPTLRVVDIAALARVTERANVKLLIDNTFATPCQCRPLELGADLVVESVSKMMNGHSDVMLGIAAGRGDEGRIRDVLSVWGLASSPFDCWLAERGLSSLALRHERASATAMAVARMLSQESLVRSVMYPGLESHPEHSAAAAQFDGRFGSLVTFDLAGGVATAERWMTTADPFAFCPSLGEIATTYSHPASTSHRGLTGDERTKLGITDGTIRLSVGVESTEFVLETLQRAFRQLSS